MLLAHCTFKASMPDSRVFLSWSLMMMNGLPYSSNASVPNADIFTDVLWHLIDLNRAKKMNLAMETLNVALQQAAQIHRRLLEGSTGGEGTTMCGSACPFKYVYVF